MRTIESKEQIEEFQNNFGAIWDSATFRASVLTINEEYRVPNGEIIFHTDERDEHEGCLYQHNEFSIYEKTLTDPFDLLHQLTDGNLTLDGEPIETDISLIEANTSGYFQTGLEESRVFDDRPKSELNAAFAVDIPDEADYNNAIDEVDDSIKNAEEPFFDISRAEYYYFDYAFRGKSKVDPRLLLFAPTDLNLTLEEDHTLEFTFPDVLSDKLDINIHPVRPLGKQKGRKIRVEEVERESVDERLSMVRETLDLTEIERIYVSIFAEDTWVIHEEYRNSDAETVNDRYTMFNKYDQRGLLEKYLTEADDSDLFETAVLNLLGIAGYRTLWFGDTNFNIPNFSTETSGLPFDEIDIVGHAPDGSRMLFVECTLQNISEKEDVLERVSNIAAELREDEDEIQIGEGWSRTTSYVPCIATPQSEVQLNNEIVEDFTSKGFEILTGEDLVQIYDESMRNTDFVPIGPDHSVWWENPL